MSSPFERPAPARLPPLPRSLRRIVLWGLAAIFAAMVVVPSLFSGGPASLVCGGNLIVSVVADAAQSGEWRSARNQRSVVQSRHLFLSVPSAGDCRRPEHVDHVDVPVAAGDDGDVLAAERH